jgi:hypothetical protein
MKENTRNTIHIGVNFIVAPAPALDTGRYLMLQERLAEEHVEFAQLNKTGTQIVLSRPQPYTLQVQLGLVAPPTGQLLIIGGATAAAGTGLPIGVSPGHFRVEAQTISEVFREVWPETQQVLSRDAAIRMLFDADSEHAFQYLWEQRLKQPEQALEAFGRPVLGGGLRLVMGASPTDPELSMVEVKIESFLSDANKIYVETILQWHQPAEVTEMDPVALIDVAENFIADRVIPFIQDREG